MNFQLEFTSATTGLTSVMGTFHMRDDCRSSDMFAVCTILKSFAKCDCGAMTLKRAHQDQFDEVVTLDDLLVNFGKYDLLIMESWMDRPELLSCFADEFFLNLFEAVHKDVNWMCIGSHMFYSDWLETNRVPYKPVGCMKYAVLFEIDMQRNQVRMIKGNFVLNQESKELMRLPTPVCFTTYGPSALFSGGIHRPFPRLRDICLLPVLTTGLFHHLPKTMRSQFAEWRSLLMYFGHVQDGKLDSNDVPVFRMVKKQKTDH